ncbi:TatD family hydrolase [Aliiglaciecola sp. CAU 1673]|uniref:TatD family hydrolase n=1 Tax=Aliiglaciecola sp. CAU 1673 TaxID=3032595 RepID=UPI0023DC7BEA|nr:TatD family hydrolase [Aliiglaciecola sp. CAU 1673]MDF2178737.1 TatD family hydrolase [Aliiglaciecola sp. CAU 1673]
MAWFDIGVNLTSSRFSQDLSAVIERAESADVLFLLITGTNLDHSGEAALLAQQWKQYSTAGIHPHYASEATEDFAESLRSLAALPCVKAIGECGLDFNRNFSSKEDQVRVFEQQLELACELALPVFLHERDAFKEQIALLKRYRPGLVGGVAHCFTGDQAQMEAYLELDLHIGITGWLCDERRGQALRDAVVHLPLNRLLLETDAPYLAPRHVRPKIERNEPRYLPVIAEVLSALTNTPVATLEKQSLANSLSLFTIESQHHVPN